MTDTLTGETFKSTPKGYERAVRQANAAETLIRDGKPHLAVNALADALQALDGQEDAQALALRARLREQKIGLQDAIRRGNGKNGAAAPPARPAPEPAPTTRVCDTCHTEKPLDAEHFRPAPRPGAFWRVCKVCAGTDADADGKRRCGTCGGWKPADTDHFRPDGHKRLRRVCRECESRGNAARQQRKRDAEGRPRRNRSHAAHPAAPTGPALAPIPVAPIVPAADAERALRWALRQAATAAAGEWSGAVETVRLLGGLCDAAGMGAAAMLALVVEELLPAAPA